MPPKSKPSPKSAKAPAAPPKVPRWCYAVDATTWKPYSEAENRIIEKAYADGFKPVTVGTYLVNTKMMKQVHVSDPMRERRVKRFMVDASGSSIGNEQPSTKPAPTAVVVVDDSDALAAKKSRKEALPRPPSETSTESEKEAPVAPLAPPLPPPPPPPAPAVALTRGTGGQFAVLNESRLAADHATWSALQSVLSNVPPINRMSLGSAAEKMHKSTRNWLRQLGRPAEERGVFITVAPQLSVRASRDQIAMSTRFTTTAGKLQTLAGDARITYAGAKPADVLIRCTDPHKPTPMSDKEHLATQLLMISGPAFVLYDNDYDPIDRPPVVYIASIPGINFAYGHADIKAFTHAPIDEETGESGPTQINKEVAIARMVLIWLHVLTVLDEVYKCEFAVLCAIGCGAFRGKFGMQVPRLWGSALVLAMSRRGASFKHIKSVFVSLPTFGTDNNFAPFKAAAEATLRELKPSVRDVIPTLVLMEDASMIAVAVNLASDGHRVGILNPSDVQAIRHGWIGMYWDGGHIALEEVLAMQTSILLQHIGLNKSLYTSSSRLQSAGV